MERGGRGPSETWSMLSWASEDPEQWVLPAARQGRMKAGIERIC